MCFEAPPVAEGQADTKGNSMPKDLTINLDGPADVLAVIN